MWNIISCKSQYKDYLKKQQDAQLLKSLQKIRPQIDNSRPVTMKPSSRKTIDQKFRGMRDIQILQENKSLLQRMLKIDLQKKISAKIPESASVKSLNSNFRKRKFEEIQDSNFQLMRRLESTNSVYSITKWEKFSKHQDYISRNISSNSGRLNRRKQPEDQKKIIKLESLGYSVDNSFENLLIK
jgi:Hemingway/CFA97